MTGYMDRKHMVIAGCAAMLAFEPMVYKPGAYAALRAPNLPLARDERKLTTADHERIQMAEQKRKRKALKRWHNELRTLAGKVVVINPEGYIGESTRREIAYAEKIGKPVEYTDALHSLGCEG